MMRKRIILILSTILILFMFFACVSIEEELKIESNLNQEALNQFSDQFNTLNEDLWEPSANASEWQENNFKLGTIQIENGQLVIKTKTGAFSKANLSSKFFLRGDYDFQIDCEIDLNERVQNMTQNFSITAGDAVSKKKENIYKDLVWIEFIKDPDEAKFIGKLNSGSILNGKQLLSYGVNLNQFKGTVRLIRKGNTVSALYKKDGNETWKRLNKYRNTDVDHRIILSFSNYFMKRKKINADKVLCARFDNFRINAAQQIIANDI